jgi:hypothetical protein
MKTISPTEARTANHLALEGLYFWSARKHTSTHAHRDNAPSTPSARRRQQAWQSAARKRTRCICDLSMSLCRASVPNTTTSQQRIRYESETVAFKELNLNKVTYVWRASAPNTFAAYV